MHFSSDHCSEKHAASRLCFSFCFRSSRLRTIVAGMRSDGLCALEELIVAFCDSAHSAEVVG